MQTAPQFTNLREWYGALPRPANSRTAGRQRKLSSRVSAPQIACQAQRREVLTAGGLLFGGALCSFPLQVCAGPVMMTDVNSSLETLRPAHFTSCGSVQSLPDQLE